MPATPLCASMQKKTKKTKQYCLQIIRGFLPFRSVVLTIGD